MPNYLSIPSVDQFRRDTGGTTFTIGHQRAPITLGSHRSADADRMIDLVYNLLGEYARTQKLQVQVILDILGQIYIITRAYFKKAGKQDRRWEAVGALSAVVDAELCVIMDCSPATLRDQLRDWFGKDLYNTTDKPGIDTELMDRDKLQKYKLVFRAGVVYMWNWYDNPEKLKLVRVNTRNIMAEVISPGFAGYALGLGYSFYTARHHEKNDPKRLGFTHGTYKVGRNVLCAGEIAIVNGKIKCITNSSGHYQPGAEKMIHVLRALVMNGVDIRGIAIHLVTRDSAFYYWAQDFLARGGQMRGLVPMSNSERRDIYLSIPGWMETVRRKNGGSEAEIIELMMKGWL